MGSTLKAEFELSGVGLHFGVKTTVKVMPANPGDGRYFVRVDLPEKPIIPAEVAAVGQTTLSTELVAENVKVRTVEHLLASLSANGIDEARIEINGEEVPLLDGSAKIWCEEIARSGIAIHNSALIPSLIVLREPVWIREGDAFVAALPASDVRFTYGIDFPYDAIGNQWHSWNPTQEDFTQEIAPARTFGFADQIEQLQQAGLIKGGSLENALVCSHSGWVNPPLRFTNEPARHKLLDLVGDMSLLGQFPTAHIIAYKASHKLHIQLANKLTEIGS
ncbi:UDP-3-O-acyl-N-acetylglucosamine deacetylase [Waterburya agarophytonicola K14]|uniref:UDP-3-O-acyl-N-acetylglucosamine deacetylase n=1 Tax=Waterburya agarophytonicola KI4 TaxID=2874699 RepID=A0A964BNX7_9CYAN|nr:UDP-3-O-acyl-N-acetylglucosamine deacetylase [Waterburya agarophytonicola]MCC0176730.1 UDP-3-O-acyl-N-acetylglucosamine deacetylase [Waterburya agarophytonicola KI4]